MNIETVDIGNRVVVLNNLISLAIWKCSLYCSLGFKNVTVTTEIKKKTAVLKC